MTSSDVAEISTVTCLSILNVTLSLKAKLLTVAEPGTQKQVTNSNSARQPYKNVVTGVISGKCSEVTSQIMF